MKVLVMMVFVVVMMVACGGEEPKVDEVVCQMMFDCYENPTVSYLSPDENPFQSMSECQNIVKENVKKGDVDCLLLLDSCDVFDDVKLDSCLEYLH